MTSESCALDLGSAEAKAWIGVENPHRAEMYQQSNCVAAPWPAFVPVVPVRVRAPAALLGFLADHSRSKDTRSERSTGRVGESAGLCRSRSEFSDKNLYLTRPDMGRRLCGEAVEALKAQCVANSDVQAVISDGLSTDAITVNYEEIPAAADGGPERSRAESRYAILCTLWSRED
ncbi:ethanolamine ammonia-lyase light chain EutC [Shigella sonnei]